MPKILIIDSSESNASLLSLYLTQQGHEVVTAEDGEKVMEAFQRERPSIVITEIKMPKMDGIEVLKAVKDLDENVQVIVITEHENFDVAIEALKLGASDYLDKPVRTDLLAVAVKRAEKRIQMRQKLREASSKLELKEMELVTQERSSTIGKTVMGMAHYVKNILNGLEGGVYMVNTGMKKNKPDLLSKGWSIVQKNVNKISDFVINVLVYVEEKAPDLEYCSPNDIAEEVCDLLEERAAQCQVDLFKDFDVDMTECYLDQRGLQHCLTNVAKYAIDNLEQDPPKDRTPLLIKTESEEGGVRFDISVSGLDLSEEIKEMPFEKFVTAKGSKGIGFGLLVAQKIVEKSGGSITFESTRGKGGTFSIHLPCSADA